MIHHKKKYFAISIKYISSSVDTVTVTHTTDLVVHYHGRAINTQLLEEEVGLVRDVNKIPRNFHIVDSSNQYMSRW